MSISKDTFRDIRPETMTKLKQIIEMGSRGSEKYAKKIADSIGGDEPRARCLAYILTGEITDGPAEFHAYAKDLTTRTLALEEKIHATKATFSAGQRFRIMGASSAYGTVVVRPQGEGQRIGIPVIMDGDRFVTYRAVYEMEAING